ncbi:MAG: DMT family transporter [Bauldia litoralis]
MAQTGGQPDRPMVGIAWMCTSMFLFVCLDATARHLTQHYSVGQIPWVRFVIFVLFAVALIGPGNFAGAFRTSRPIFQIARALLMLAEIGTFTLAFRYLSVADVHAVAASTPLMVTALAVVFLGEKVGLRRWIAVLIGFAAVIVILRPGVKELYWYHLIPVLGAAFWAVYQVMIRIVSRTDSSRTTLAYTAVIGAAIMTVIGPFDWQPPDLEGWGMLLLSGVLGAGAHYTLILALGAAPASHVQPFIYTTFLWALVIGLIAFGEFPDAVTVGAAGVIIAVGLYVMNRERQLAAAAARGQAKVG